MIWSLALFLRMPWVRCYYHPLHPQLHLYVFPCILALCDIFSLFVPSGNIFHFSGTVILAHLTCLPFSVPLFTLFLFSATVSLSLPANLLGTNPPQAHNVSRLFPDTPAFASPQALEIRTRPNQMVDLKISIHSSPKPTFNSYTKPCKICTSPFKKSFIHLS